MAGFRDIKTLQKFASAHAAINDHFNQDRSAAFTEWRQIAA